MPPAVFSSASSGSTTTRSSSGRTFRLTSFSFAIGVIPHSYVLANRLRKLPGLVCKHPAAYTAGSPVCLTSCRPCHPSRPCLPFHPCRPCLPCRRGGRDDGRPACP